MKKRWFVLQGKYLYYHSSPTAVVPLLIMRRLTLQTQGKKPKGQIPLLNSVVEEEPKNHLGFRIRTKENDKTKDFYLEDVNIVYFAFFINFQASKLKWLQFICAVEGVEQSPNNKEVRLSRQNSHMKDIW